MSISIHTVQGGVPRARLVIEGLRNHVKTPGGDPSRLLELLAEAVELDQVEDATTFIRDTLEWDVRMAQEIIQLRHRSEDKPEVHARMRTMRSKLRDAMTPEARDAKGGPIPAEHPNAGATSVRDNTSAHILARLKRDAKTDEQAAELRDALLEGDISANEAAKRMGWRKDRVSVVKSPEGFAKAITRHLDPAEWDVVIKGINDARKAASDDA